MAKVFLRASGNYSIASEVGMVRAAAEYVCVLAPLRGFLDVAQATGI